MALLQCYSCFSTLLLQLLVSLSKSYASTQHVKMPTWWSKTMSRTVFSAHVKTDSQKMADEIREFEVFLTNNPDIKRKFEASKARNS